MSITLHGFANGDTDYVSGLNANNSTLKTAIDALQLAVSDALVGATLGTFGSLDARLEAIEDRAAHEQLRAFAPGVPANAAVIWQWVATRAMKIPSGTVGSQASAVVAPTASTVLTVKKNGTTIGTITYASVTGSFTGTWAGADTTFVAGDLITVHNQATADATLAGITLALVATLT